MVLVMVCETNEERCHFQKVAGGAAFSAADVIGDKFNIIFLVDHPFLQPSGPA